MRSVKYDFRGSEYVLAVTAAALFSIYDQFGTGDVFETTKCMDPSLDGWESCCHLAALLSEQGAAQREYLHRAPVPTLDAEFLMRTASPTDAVNLRRAIREAFRLGFAREIAEDRDEEVNLVLLEREREDAEKKRIPRRDPGAVAGRGGALPQLERARGAAPLAGGVFRHARRRFAAEAGRIPRLGGRR